jgi:hypothetical protein
MLTEIDYHKQYLLNMVLNLNYVMNEKLCQLYKSFINLYSKLDDEFFTFNDFNGNEAILYSDQSRIFIPTCVDIDHIDVVEETEKCYKDFPVKFIYHNNTINAFLTHEKIIKMTSKIVSCKNNYLNIHLKMTHRILSKEENKTIIEDDRRYRHIQINLQNTNLTKINYKHDTHIINSINLMKKFTNITEHKENHGHVYIYQDDNTEIRNELLTLRTHVEDNVLSLWSTMSHYSATSLIIGYLMLNIIKKVMHKYATNNFNPKEMSTDQLMNLIAHPIK